MQTFAPHGGDLRRGFEALDTKRLGKQRVEGLQIYNALTERSKGWRNHPATRMWRGHEVALAAYTHLACAEWTGRGYTDSVADKITALVDADFGCAPLVWPAWMMDTQVEQALALSHQSNLIRKLPEHYQQLWPNTPQDLPYVWPV